MRKTWTLCKKLLFYSQNNLVNRDENKNLDMRYIKLNNKRINALFDTGSSINIVTRDISNLFRGIKIKMLENVDEIKLLNGASIKCNESISLDIEYKNKVLKEEFFIIESGIVDVIVGQLLVKKFSKGKIFPIECRIPATNDHIVSWSRPIKNIKDKEDFKKLLAEYLTKEIIERSKSLWLNPVVLNRKKTVLCDSR
ncbi:hypothetical protein DMUE_2425 [Dictyocoela muelleri]|nr:hypothetical protein DMUE_2425 [Dictyocoela muelleri]